MARNIAERNKIDLAFKKAINRGVQAVSGRSPEGPAPSIHEVVRDLVFELTGDARYRPTSR